MGDNLTIHFVGRALGGVIPPEECAVCGQLVAASTLLPDRSMGRACILCRTAAERIRARLSIAQGRQRASIEGQMRQAVRDVRSGTTDLPTFDQADLAC